MTEKTYEKIPGEFLGEQLAAIPVANDGMTVEELRQICLSYMRLQISFQWLPSQDYDYLVSTQKHPVSLKKGTLHGGLPYVNLGTGNLYRILEYYDPETGEIDLSELGENKEVLGNACSGATAFAWARCISSARLGFSFDMTQYNGMVNLGAYTYPKDLKKFLRPIRGRRPEENITVDQKYTPKTVCAENGAQVMYESYAKALPADGIVSGGHIRMVSSVPTVSRKPNGEIDGERSFLLYCDQVCYESAWHHVRFTEAGDLWRIHGGLDVKVSFASLFQGGYIPFTFKEFLGTAPVQKARIATGIETDEVSVEELKKKVFSANYPLSDLFFEGKGNKGAPWRFAVRRIATTASELDLYETSLARCVSPEQWAVLQEKSGEPFKIWAQLLNGEKILAYSGTLMG